LAIGSINAGALANPALPVNKQAIVKATLE